METTLKPILRRAGLLVIAALTGLTLTNCKSIGGSSSSMNYDPPAYRPKNPAAAHVKLSTSKQAVYVMEGNRVLMATPCSVGTAQDPTPKGNFTIYKKDFDKRRVSNPGAGYPMTYWCEFKTAYGLHWGFVKPYPCTHGCVRLPKMAAAKLFAMVSVGTPINIATHQPEDATVGATLPVLDDSSLPNPPDSYLKSNQVFEDAKYRGKMFID
jgi:hypothetical protein